MNRHEYRLRSGYDRAHEYRLRSGYDRAIEALERAGVGGIEWEHWKHAEGRFRAFLDRQWRLARWLSRKGLAYA